jgi:hypothetical protein
MRRLRDAGIALTLIAELAGITLNGVRNRLRPKSKRQPKPYSFRSPRAKRAYLTRQRDRQKQYQRKSLKHAKNAGAWTPQEIRFLEKHASELTLVELAIHLERTYHSVSHYINRHGIKTRK